MTGNKINGSLIWITGLAGSGKTTIGKLVYNHIKAKHSNTVFSTATIIEKLLGKLPYILEKEGLM